MSPKLDYLEGKAVLILGFGREGASTYKFLRRHFPNKKLDIADIRETSALDKSEKRLIKQDKFLKLHLGKKYLESLSDYHVVFKTPGIPFRLPEIKETKKAGCEFTSQTKLFFELCQGVIIGVTGTKGKSTTATLIHEILENGGFKSTLLGNIGKLALDYLNENFGKGKIFVFELSSHQLADLDKSPHIAVFLNIFREHLDYYESFRQYVGAKENITQSQKRNDYLVYNLNDQRIRKIATKTKAKKLPFSLSKTKDSSCYPMEGHVVFRKNGQKEAIVKIREVSLKGKYNLNNVMAAVIVGKILGAKTEKIKQAVKNFRPLEHRLEEVGTFKGVTFIDDSLATIPEATIVAVEALKGKVGSIILGGSDRGQDFSNLANVLLENKIKILILLPATGERIWEEVKERVGGKAEEPKHFFVDNMEDAVKLCFENTPQGKICLLSTASPSFSLFRDYEEKARLFRKYVRLFGKGKE